MFSPGRDSNTGFSCFSVCISSDFFGGSLFGSLFGFFCCCFCCCFCSFVRLSPIYRILACRYVGIKVRNSLNSLVE